MKEPTLLNPTELIEGRPFSDPQQNEPDVALLRYMVDRLRNLVSRETTSQIILDPLREADGSVHRIFVLDRAAVLTQATLTAVGFFGQARTDVDHEPIMEIENELIEQMDAVPGLLVYYNLYQPGQGFGNLVICAEEAVNERWRDQALHIRAVDEFAPQHYHSIRLHNGLLSGGLMSGALTLTRTKYFDFRDGPMWRGLREFV